MKKFIFIVIGSIFLVSCTPKQISEKSEYSHQPDNLTIMKEATTYNLTAPQLQEKEYYVMDKLPLRLRGTVEDDSLKVSIDAVIEEDQKYKTEIIFSNKTDQSLDLIFDCGLLVSNDFYAPKTGICPAVESMSLQGNDTEVQTIQLTYEFVNQGNMIMTVRYRQNSLTKDLNLQLQKIH